MRRVVPIAREMKMDRYERFQRYGGDSLDIIGVKGKMDGGDHEVGV